MSDNTEFKVYDNAEVKASAATEDGKMRFEGYLAYFDNVDSYGDAILKGAFSKSLSEIRAKGKVIPVLEQHGDRFGLNSSANTPIGYYEEMKEDTKGLYVKGVLATSTRGRDMYELLKSMPKGAMSMSIGYRVMGEKKPTDEEYRSTGVERYLTEIDLREGSVVTFPANEKAKIEDVKAEAKKRRDLERYFKDNGFSSSESTKIVALIRDMGMLKDASEEIEEKEEKVEDESIKGLTEILNSVKQVSTELEADMAIRELRSAIAKFGK